MVDIREQIAHATASEQRSRQTHQSLGAEMRARTRRLMRPGYVERLVAQGRTPRLFGEPPFICQVPPEGIQPGDSITLAYADDIVLEFFAPDGKSRGQETSVHITPKQAEKIKERIQRAATANS